MSKKRENVHRAQPIARAEGDRLEAMPVAKMLRAHADAVFRMPTGEQFMGARDASFHSAMLQLADWIDSVEQRLRKEPR